MGLFGNKETKKVITANEFIDIVHENGKRSFPIGIKWEKPHLFMETHTNLTGFVNETLKIREMEPLSPDIRYEVKGFVRINSKNNEVKMCTFTIQRYDINEPEELLQHESSGPFFKSDQFKELKKKGYIAGFVNRGIGIAHSVKVEELIDKDSYGDIYWDMVEAALCMELFLI